MRLEGVQMSWAKGGRVGTREGKLRYLLIITANGFQCNFSVSRDIY